MAHDPVECTRAEFLAQELQELLDLADAAMESNQPGAAVAAKSKAIDVRTELDKLRAYEEDSKQQRSPLDEVRAMRRRADAAGSHVAARDLLKVELELLEKAKAEEKEAEQRRLAHLTTDQRMEMLIRAVASLPPELRAALHDAVYAPVH